MNNNINFKELRLDNYICINNNLHPCRVKEITMSSVVVESIKENYIEPTINSMNPIPLTEEWLLNFGFEENSDYASESNNYNDYLKGGVRICMPYFTFYFENGEDEIEVKYVHQLQNLYFALTNEELTMK